MASYKIKGNWSPALGYEYEGMPDVTVEVCDLIIEHRDGTVVHTWADGAYRVKAEGFTTRTFKGETAWSKAARHARDLQDRANRSIVSRNLW